MTDYRLDALAGLYEEGDAFLRKTQTAAQASGGTGSDHTESVSVSLDTEGRVVKVTVAVGWQRRLNGESLSEAVLEAVRDASTRRLTAWGEAFGEGAGSRTASASDDSAGIRSVAGPKQLPFDHGDFQRRLQSIMTGPMSPEDRHAALTGLLEMVEAVERGIDEVSGKMQTTLAATHTGQSPDRHATVTVTGGGEVSAVRLDRSWLRQAHEANIGRQLTAAFRAAYEKVAANGVTRLIAESPLGEVQRLTRDPLGVARKLRLTD